MYDGSTGTYEMLKRLNTVQVIATAGGKILTTREEQPGRPVRDFGLYGGRGGGGGETPENSQKETF